MTSFLAIIFVSTNRNNTMETYKTFDSSNNLLKQTRGRDIVIEISNGYFISVAKKSIKAVAEAMERNREKFQGDITIYHGLTVQVRIFRN